MVYQGPNLLVVNASHRSHGIRRDGWKVGSSAIVDYLLGSLTSGDGASNRIEHQYPAQGELAHRDPTRQEFSHLSYRRQANLVVHSGEGLAHVEGLTLSIEVAVIVFREA